MKRREMKRSVWIILALLLITTTVLSACVQGAAPAQQPAAKETVIVEVTAPPQRAQTIRFGAGSTFLDPYLVPFFTITKEILAEKGVTLEYITLSTDEAVEAALDRNRIDVSMLSTVGLNRAVSQGLTMDIILGGQMQNTFILTVPQNVTNLEQLRDSRVAAQSRTSLSVSVAEIMLREEAGLEPGEDYEMVYLPGSDNRAAAMEASNIDAAVIFRSVAADLEQRTDGKFKIYGGLWDVLDPMLWEAHVGSQEFLANEELTTAYVEAVMETYRRFYDRDALEMSEEKQVIPEADPLTVETLADDFRLYQDVGLYPVDGGLDPVYYERITDFLVEVGQLTEDQVVPYEEAVVTTFLEKVQGGN